LSKQRLIAEQRARDLVKKDKPNQIYPIAEINPMVELPLAHITLGCPGVVWPKQTSYRVAF
jgi:hypothetical protein